MDCDALEAMLGRGQDSLLLRFGLGGEYCRRGDYEHAIPHLRAALAFDAQHAAAWKLLGAALAETGRIADAREAYKEGIKAAETAGHLQAAKEMAVFLKRLNRSAPP